MADAAPMVNACYRHQMSELFGGPTIQEESVSLRGSAQYDSYVDPGETISEEQMGDPEAYKLPNPI